MSGPESALDELWTDLEPHIDWPRGFALILLFADHPWAVDELRRRAQLSVRNDERALLELVPRTADELPGALLRLITPVEAEVRAVWVELWRGSGEAEWDAGVGNILARLNERRTGLERELRRPLVLVLPSSFRARVYVIAPDLWTIRSFTADLPLPAVIPWAPELAIPGEPARPSFNLPPPSFAEKEWARMVGLGQPERVSVWDGLRAVDTALERGRLASARHIAQQVLGLILRGELDDASVMSTDELLRELEANELDPGRQELVAAIHRLGNVEDYVGNRSAARKLFRRSLQLAERIAAADPRDLQARRNLCVSLSKLGNIEARAGDISAARLLFQRSLELDEQLAAADPHSAQARRELAFSLGQLGNTEAIAGNVSAARELLRRSLDLREQLAAADPHSAQAQHDLCVSLDNLGRLEAKSGNLSAARSLFQRCLDLAEQLVAANPDSARAQRELALTHFRFINLADQLDDPKLRSAHLDAVLEIIESLAARDLIDGHDHAEWILDRLRRATQHADD